MPKENILSRMMMASMALLFSLAVAACDDGPAEEAGEAIDDAAEEVGDALD